jgi:hypothetical protein
LDVLTAYLTKNCIVKETFERNPLENGLSDDDAENFSGYFEQLFYEFVEIKFIAGGGAIT